MAELVKKRGVRTWGAIPEEVKVCGALSHEDGSPGVTLVCDDEPVLAVSLAAAKRFLAELEAAIADAQQMAWNYGPNVRKARKAGGN